MFAESTHVCLLIRTIVLYIYNEHIFARCFLSLISIILLYTISIYKKEEHSFPHILYLLPRTFLTLIYSFIIYSIYRYREYFSATFYPFPHSFIILLIYRMIHTFPAPFLPLYKVNTFLPPLSLSF